MKNNRIFNIDISKVPFIPALDLLEKKNNLLSENEAAAVALALYLSLENSAGKIKSKWQANALKEANLQRI